MVRNRFNQEKRAKEIARQKKQEEKLLRRQNRVQPKLESPESEVDDERM
ncbi:hypothetical protein [Desulfobacca acetoxidans]|uniref:Heterogeneous nuclear ribonucleoprotein U-like 1 n=1 Tax=Desulfobacca acetoxidans (strain ATCC 700848 / DSM 11109 / ASRB2) TaxID=880072 RepID=F2NCN1_DESAR|nr:hypothetical protein [Desulfobacca acetoxidans]AEB09165.1 heterogeneous nuclear ribonucleoprotein U-like 1 [Desulfobacca acetoxidans DSM 11109]